jgi:hypothetical protein
MEKFKMSKEKNKQEAIRRMKVLRLMDEVISDFKNYEKLYKSENGILYWLEDSEKETVKKFEDSVREYNGIVYHTIIRNTTTGKIMTILFVSDDEDQKIFDANIKENIIFTYLDAGTTEWFSEYGTEYVSPRFGALIIPDIRSQEDYKELISRKEFI